MPWFWFLGEGGLIKIAPVWIHNKKLAIAVGVDLGNHCGAWFRLVFPARGSVTLVVYDSSDTRFLFHKIPFVCSRILKCYF